MPRLARVVAPGVPYHDATGQQPACLRADTHRQARRVLRAMYTHAKLVAGITGSGSSDDAKERLIGRPLMETRGHFFRQQRSRPCAKLNGQYRLGILQNGLSGYLPRVLRYSPHLCSDDHTCW